MKNTQNDAGTPNQRLGNVIQALRERIGITQERLSELAKVDMSELSKLENGSLHEIPIKTLIRICPHLNVSLDYLLVSYYSGNFTSDYERFYDFDGNELDLFKIAQNLYSVDAEFLILLSSPEFLSNQKLIATLKETILSFSKNN